MGAGCTIGRTTGRPRRTVATWQGGRVQHGVRGRGLVAGPVRLAAHPRQPRRLAHGWGASSPRTAGPSRAASLSASRRSTPGHSGAVIE